MTTSRDIARAAGVSQSTVSRVLQGSPRVSPSARERILRAMAELDYRPNALARAMKTQRIGTVGVIVARITNPYYPQLLDNLARQLTRAGLRTVIWDAESDGERAAIEACESGIVDGLLHAAVLGDTPDLERLLARRPPLVLVSRELDDERFDQVASDNAAGARRAAHYVADHGRRRIAVISGPSAISTFRERTRGFLDGLAERAVAAGEPIRVDRVSYHTGLAAMAQLLAGARRPDTVFCGNDALAFGALDAARRAGVRVPDDLWIVGFDDVDMASWQAFDLTTVRQPIEAIARRAVERLVARLDGCIEPVRRLRMPCELVIRGSTAHAGAGADGPTPDLSMPDASTPDA